jgi:hypothetical protein
MAFPTTATATTEQNAPGFATTATPQTLDLSQYKPGDEIPRNVAEQIQDKLLEGSLGVPTELADLCKAQFAAGTSTITAPAKVLKHVFAHSSAKKKDYSVTKVEMDVAGKQYKFNVLFVRADKGATVNVTFTPISTDIARTGVQATATP